MNLEIQETRIPGCLELLPVRRVDERGAFIKTYHHDWFAEMGLQTAWTEEYYSVSKGGVVRGMHFQLPPHDHAKLVYCVAGQILDVAVDLRVGSPTYGAHVAVELSADRANMMYLPAGLAHGFATFDQPATVVYNVTSVYHPESDAGIRWDSIEIAWPVVRPVVSERDQKFPTLEDFDSPFRFEPDRELGA